jgi:hypothetical protein
MNVKLGLTGLMVFSVLAVTTSGLGQKLMDEIILQDDVSGDHLIFFMSSGKYKFVSCSENFSTGGVGSVSVDGCKVVLKDISDAKRVLAEADLCSKVGKADIAFRVTTLSTFDTSPDFESIVSDTNLRDSVFDCSVKATTDK